MADVLVSKLGFRRAALVLAGLAVACIALLWLRTYSASTQVKASSRRVRIALTPTPSNALLLFAHEKGYFARESLFVELVHFQSGKAAIDALLDGRAELASAYQTTIAIRLLNGHDLRVVTELHSSISNGVLVLRKGIELAKGKDGAKVRIGVTHDTSSEFLLGLYLAANAVDQSAIETIHLEPDLIEPSLVSGRLDGAMLWEPSASLLLESAGSAFNPIEADFYSEISALVASSNPAHPNDEILRRVLRALLGAQNDLHLDRAELRSVLSRRARQASPKIVDRLLQRYDFHLGLSTLFVTILNEEASWQLRNGIQAKIGSPSELQRFLYPEPLREIRPELVTYQ